MAGKIASLIGSTEILQTETRDHMAETREMLSVACSVPLAVDWLLLQGS